METKHILEIINLLESFTKSGNFDVKVQVVIAIRDIVVAVLQSTDDVTRNIVKTAEALVNTESVHDYNVALDALKTALKAQETTPD